MGVQLACGRNSIRNLTGLEMMIPETSTLSSTQMGPDSPLISSTRHLSTPQPSASSRITLAPKLSSSLIHSTRDDAQSSAEIRVNTFHQREYCMSCGLTHHRLPREQVGEPRLLQVVVWTYQQRRRWSVGRRWRQ